MMDISLIRPISMCDAELIAWDIMVLSHACASIARKPVSASMCATKAYKELEEYRDELYEIVRATTRM